MRYLHSKKLYLPALSIIIAVLLLLVVIGISTFRNLERERRSTLDLLTQSCLSTLRVIEAGVRTGMMIPMWETDDIDLLIREVARGEDIVHIYLFNDDNIIVHHTDFDKEDRPVDWHPPLSTEETVFTRTIHNAEGTPVFEIAKIFTPIITEDIRTYHSHLMRRAERMFHRHHKGDTIVLGLNMSAFEAARHADLLHAVMMSAILIALGSGAIFFVFVIQNYYLINRTLRQTRDYTRQVVSNMANGLLSLSRNGRVIAINRPALELMGLNDDDIKRVDIKRLLDFEQTGIQETLSENRPIIDREFELTTAHNERIILAVSATPIYKADGTSEGVVIELRDLRGIKRLEEKVKRTEKLAAIGRLAAGVAHEIRNPLSSIRGFAQFFRHKLKENPKDRLYAETMVSEVDRINKVIDDLLTFARPIQIRRRPTDIGELVNHVVRLLEADTQAQQIHIEKSIPQTMPKILLDADKLTQGLLNLALNSVAAVDKNGRMCIGTRLQDAPGRIIVWVEDDGAGISPDIRNQIFDPFFTTRPKGTGLGLAIVHKIAELHDGEVQVESPPDGKQRGTRIAMVLPLELGEIRNDGTLAKTEEKHRGQQNEA